MEANRPSAKLRTTRPINPRLKGILLAAFGAILWGGSGVGGQFLLQDCHFSPEWLASARMLLAGVILLSIDASRHHGDIFSIWRDRHDAVQLLAFALIGMLGVQYTYFITILYSNAPTGTILQYLMPIIIVLWAALRAHRLPRIRETLCVLLAIAGTALIVTHGSLHTLAISPLALAWGILSAFTAAFYTVQPKELMGKWRSSLVIGWGMLGGGLALLPFAPPWQFTGTLNLSALLVFLYIVIFGTTIAFWSYLESINYIEPSETSIRHLLCLPAASYPLRAH